MIDLSFLTYPVIAALSVFVVSLFFGEDIVIEKIDVPYQLQWSGINSSVATRQFVDELRSLNERASSEIAELEVDPSSVQEGLAAFEDYFDIAAVINGSRQPGRNAVEVVAPRASNLCRSIIPVAGARESS